MARPWRNLAFRTGLLGVGITLIVLFMDQRRHLVFIERWFYDQRAQHCQFFTPPPNDLLVHLDIDDATLETIGSWPWPRTTLAQIIDELRLADARAVALDVLFSEAQEPGALKLSDGTTQTIDHDANFAAALQRFGKVLIPVSFTFDIRPAPTPRESALVALLQTDLELSLAQAQAKVSQASPDPLSESEFLTARRAAMKARLRAALARGAVPLDQLRAQLLPRSVGESGVSSVVRELENQYHLARSLQEIERFSVPHGSSDPALPVATDVTTMIPPLARAASLCGYVDYFNRPDDPIIRGVPLWITFDGRRYPQMDLALACAMKNVDLAAVRLAENQLILPEPGGAQTIIPVRSVPSQSFGTIGGYFDIPWFGSDNWQTIYDYPSYRQPRRHIPMTLPWALADARKILLRNNAQADKAIAILAEVGVSSAQKFNKTPPPADDLNTRIVRLQAIVREASELAGPVLQADPATLGADEKVFVDAIKALQRIAADNRAFLDKSAELRNAVSGKAIIIGWGATGTIDKYPTPLHASCPGVVIHGVAFNAIMSGHFWRTAPAWVNALLTLFMGLFTTFLVVRLAPVTAFFSTFLLAIVYLLINGLLVFDYGNWIVGVAGPIVALLTVWGLLTLVRLVAEARERARITRRFQSYVDPALVQYVIDHPELARLEGQVRQMTVVFTDLAGFTTFTETLREKAVAVLSRYISRMTPVIRRNRGLIHRFMGDGIMFSYGAPIDNPHKTTDAVRTVIELFQELESLNIELVGEGLPRLSMRAGVFTGPAVVGDSGAEDAAEYACLGDTTNSAARLETANKYFDTRAMINDVTAQALDGRFLLRPVGRLVLMGKKEWVMAWEPLNLADQATPDEQQLAQLTTALFDHYLAARFEECLNTADQIDARFGPSKLTDLYRKHATQYRASPPPAFQGEIRLTDK